MKIGWIGTGVMGLSMANHLQKADHEISVFNRTKSRAEPLLQKGAHWYETPADVAVHSEILFTIVGLPKDVEEVYQGEKGILSVESACRIIVDMSTGPPNLAREIEREAAKRGLDSLDAPVSGGDIGAREATLAIMVGGRRRIFEKVHPLFQLMGKNIVYMGGREPARAPRCATRFLSQGQ
jgi:3-hydroxyisobutyrate dehydrogenase